MEPYQVRHEQARRESGAGRLPAVRPDHVGSPSPRSRTSRLRELCRNPSTNAAGLVPGTLREAIPPQVIFCAARKPSSYVQLSHYAVHAVRARILSLLGRDLWQIVQLNATRWVVAAKLHPVVSHWINPCDRSEAMMGLAGSA